MIKFRLGTFKLYFQKSIHRIPFDDIIQLEAYTLTITTHLAIYSKLIQTSITVTGPMTPLSTMTNWFFVT